MQKIIIFFLMMTVMLTACGNEEAATGKTEKKASLPAAPGITANVTARRIIEADAEPGNWLTHGRTYDEQRYSPLDQINTGNVHRLGLAWYVDLPTTNGLEATPLMVDGIIYVSSDWNMIHALDAKTGREIWHYDPQTRRDWGRYTCCGPINRGVALWQGKVISATLDGRLIALDAANGKLLWEVQTTDTNQPYSITGAPRVVNGKVVIGNSGAEFGIRGYVTAYEANTGKQLWRFYTVPGNPAEGFESPAMEMAAKTWSGQWWQYGGGGTAWDSFAFDPALNLLYIGTGNGGPWSRETRSPGGGDNLFLSSIVAVNADTGAYVWHYQTVPGENWDFNSNQHMILADLEIDGVKRKVLMQAPKNGFFYVLDRATGELISAQNFVPTTWASHIDMTTGRPVEIKENLYSEEAKLITPGPNGGHDWQPMSYNPQTGLVYFPVHEMYWPYSRTDNFEFKKWAWNIGHNPEAAPPAGIKEAVSRGALLAWDPVTQQKRWEVDLGKPWNGGTLSTAGNLVVEGASDGRFVIYHAETGEKLWEKNIYTGAVAGPISYMIDGEQYIAVAAGWGGALVLMGDNINHIHRGESRMLAFKLDAKTGLPAPPAPAPLPPPPPSTASADEISHGAGLYGGLCGNCHGFNAISGGTIPDLRHMTPETHRQFADIVLGGILADNGMVSFADVLQPEDVAAIHAYVIDRANDDWPGKESTTP